MTRTLALLLTLASAPALADDDCDKTSATVQIDGATGLVYEVGLRGRRTLLADGVLELSFRDSASEPVTVDIDLVPPSDPAKTPVVPDIILRPKKTCPPPT